MMNHQCKTIGRAALTAGVIMGLASCSTMGTYFAHKDLKVDSKMSDTIFLDPLPPAQRMVYVQYKNTTTRNLDGLPVKLKNNLKANGWQVTESPDAATNMLQVAVKQAGEAKDKEAVWTNVDSGFGNAMTGGVAGVAMGLATDSIATGTMAGMGVAAADWVGTQIVKDKIDSVITDIQLSRKVDGNVKQVAASQLNQGSATQTQQVYENQSNWMRYRTRVGTLAEKVNLEFEQAAPEIEAQQAKEIAGILG